jgi:peptide/nickel transport system permease protein
VLRFIGRRLLSLGPLLIGMLVLGFAIIQLAPGDPVQLLVGDYPAPAEYVKQVRERFGLDQPRWLQFAGYAGQVARGNLGYSFFYNEPVLDLLTGRLGATLVLMTSALVISTAAGIGLGVACGRRPGSATDHVLMVVGLIGYSLPVFWLGQLLLMGLALKLDLFPTQCMRGVLFGIGPAGRALDVLHHLALPALTLATRYLALNVRLMRASLIEVGAQDYLRTARAKGLSERVVTYKHALRNALVPVVTMIGLNVGHLVAGAC